MVYVNLTGRKEMDPSKMCAYAENGGYVDDGATSWNFMTKGAQGLGLNAEELPADKSMIKGRVSAGRPSSRSWDPVTLRQLGTSS